MYQSLNAGQTWSVRDSLSGLPHLDSFRRSSESRNLVSVPSANTAYLLVGDSVARQVVQIALGRHTWRGRTLPNAANINFPSALRDILFSTDSSGLALDASDLSQRAGIATGAFRNVTELLR